ncbi:MAG TPA: glutathione S-transferase family protein [Stellaceae bacterium]|nr:glutathione S-transferase family protein [Stellaceae bacterium]
MLRIWGRKTSSNVQKVLWTCEELAIPFERVDLGGPFGGNKEPAYLAMNPNGLVPTVDDDGLIIWESNTIMRHLAATRAGGERLHPKDPPTRTTVERWMDWQNAALSPPMATLLFGFYRLPPDKVDQAAMTAARQRCAELWAMVEHQLDGKDFIAGKNFTLADISLGIFIHRWHVYPIERPPAPRLKAWYGRLGERPGFRAHVAGPVS